MKMTSAARETLEDCRGALAELADGVQGRDWRRKWILAVVLLRAVGHVLDKVDGSKTSTYRAAIDRWWSELKASKPAPSIFWHLIDEERNTILKEYQTTASQGVTLQPTVIEINVRTGEQKVDPPKPPIYHYTFNSGPYKERDQREVLLEAIAWWEQQLDLVDREANAP
jgi:hypothetical protein